MNVPLVTLLSQPISVTISALGNPGEIKMGPKGKGEQWSYNYGVEWIVLMPINEIVSRF